jgi:hypothetical protein
MATKGWPWREIRRGIFALLLPGLIIWLGGDALTHINELYDGLCPVQGPGMASLLFDGNPQGNCTGIGAYLGVLGLIMGLAALASATTLILWWKYTEHA